MIENKSNIRPCRQCGKMVDFNEPWCDHETMEESAWLDIKERQKTTILDKDVEDVIDDLVHKAALELGHIKN